VSYTKEQLITILAPAITKNGNTTAAVKAMLENTSMAELLTMFDRQKAAGIISDKTPPAQTVQTAELAAARETARQLEEAYERKLEADATHAANLAIWELNRKQQREVEEAAQLHEDKRTFQYAARRLGLSGNDANFSVVRSTLGPGFDVYQVQQAVQSSAVRLSPASEAELNQYAQEAVQAEEQYLKKLAQSSDPADAETLRRIVRQNGAQMAARAQGQHQEHQVQIRAEKDQAVGFPVLPETDQYGQALDSLFFRKLSNTNYDGSNGKDPANCFKQYVRKYGAAQINERLRQGIK
jgi:hypothetical protein